MLSPPLRAGTYRLFNVDGDRAPNTCLHVKDDHKLKSIRRGQGDAEDTFFFKIEPSGGLREDGKQAYQISHSGSKTKGKAYRVQTNFEENGLELEGDARLEGKPQGWNDFVIEPYGKPDADGRQVYVISDQQKHTLHIKGS